jgi:SAM-dependent methyltransferase
MTDADTLIADTLRRRDFRRATFAGVPRGGPCPWVRVVVRPVDLRGERHLQFSYFDATKDVTKNFRLNEVSEPLAEVLAVRFSGIHLTTATEEIDVRTSKKGKVHVGRRAAETADTPVSHNRVKDVPLPEGRADRLLEVMGVMDAAGRVKPTMRAKFTQINEFLKHLSHVLDDAGLRHLGRPVELLDCGCGSSHLTLAVHHYLNDVLGVPARIIGVDVNDEVIRKSVTKAERLGAAGVNFAVGKIGELAVKPDVVLALHACDTATDDALAQAVRSEAKLVLSVPCCHRHLNQQLKAERVEVLRPLLRHGVLHQRAADLFTDTFRALALRMAGYKTDVVEFVGTEHTPRNLMIRAVRGAPPDPQFAREYGELKRFLGVVPYIETLLGEPAVSTAGCSEPPAASLPRFTRTVAPPP